MKQKASKVLLASLLLVFILPVLVQGQTQSGASNPPAGQSAGTQTGASNPPKKTLTLTNPLKVDSIGGAVGAFVEVFSYLVVLFAVLALVWVGFQFILARGNPERMKELKNWLFFIIIGVAIVIGARVIIMIVTNTLQATGTVDPNTIQSIQKL